MSESKNLYLHPDAIARLLRFAASAGRFLDAFLESRLDAEDIRGHCIELYNLSGELPGRLSGLFSGPDDWDKLSWKFEDGFSAVTMRKDGTLQFQIPEEEEEERSEATP